MAKKDYSKLEKDDLLKVIEKLESRKKYGLIWDEEKTKEQFEKESENALPVLKEVKGKEIKTDPSKPTNILIEGDNYHALSVLNYTHQGKIDVIYIDPPYNTGNKDFKYNDHWVDKEDSYRHSKWLSFMSKRLQLAKLLLSNRGVIFISIDDNEYSQLKLLCNEIFGENNFIDTIIWKKTENIKMDSKFLSQNKDYILCYRRSGAIQDFAKEYSDIGRFKLEDEKGKYYLRKLDSLSSSYSRGMDYIIEYKGKRYYPGGSKIKWEERQKINPGKKAPTWLWSKTKYEEGLKNNEIVFKGGNIYNKVRYDGIAKKPYINIQNIVSQQTAQKELDDMFGKRVFDHPKPPQLIEWLVNLIENNKNITIVDFFAGSGTTGHAILNLNKDNIGKRTFILCTNNEENICSDICYPRIQKAIKGYQTPKGRKIAGLGGNLKYYKTAFVKNSISRDDLKMRITRECTEMLCLREGIFDEVKAKPDYHIFEQNGRIMGVYYSMERDSLSQLKKELDKMEGEKILYCFTFDPLGLDKNDFADWQGVSLEPIPQKILDIYEQIYEY